MIKIRYIKEIVQSFNHSIHQVLILKLLLTQLTQSLFSVVLNRTIYGQIKSAL